MEKKISRRDFLKGSVAGTASLAAAGLLASCAAKPDPTPTANNEVPVTPPPASYDKEVDFLIVGYGLAGEAAALEANDIDPNAKICVLEKMPERLAGGNSIASGQTVILPNPDDLDTFRRYLYACSQPNPIKDEYLDYLVKEFAEQGEWIQGTVEKVDYEFGYVGGGPINWGSLVTEFPDLDGASFSGCSSHVQIGRASCRERV